MAAAMRRRGASFVWLTRVCPSAAFNVVGTGCRCDSPGALALSAVSLSLTTTEGRDGGGRGLGEGNGGDSRPWPPLTRMGYS